MCIQPPWRQQAFSICSTWSARTLAQRAVQKDYDRTMPNQASCIGDIFHIGFRTKPRDRVRKQNLIRKYVQTHISATNPPTTSLIWRYFLLSSSLKWSNANYNTKSPRLEKASPSVKLCSKSSGNSARIEYYSEEFAWKM